VKVVLALILIVGVLRLALSMAGVPNDTTRWLSMTVLLLVGAVYCGVRVAKTGFGGYRQLLPQMVLLSGGANILAALAILIGIVTGLDNVFTAPEFSGGEDGKTWFHFGAHIVLGLTVFPLVLWGLSSLAMLVAKKLTAPKDAAAAKA
jgi:small basic protein